MRFSYAESMIDPSFYAPLAHAAEDILAVARSQKVFHPALAAPMLRATAALRARVEGAAEPFDGLIAELNVARAALEAGDLAALAGTGTEGTAESPPPAATSQADATAPDGPAANGRQPEAPAEDTQGPGQATATQDNSETPAAPAEPARSGGRRRRRKPSGASAASSTPAAPAASEPEVAGATAIPEAQNGAA